MGNIQDHLDSNGNPIYPESPFNPPQPPSYSDKTNPFQGNLQKIPRDTTGGHIPFYLHKYSSDIEKTARLTVLYCGDHCHDIGVHSHFEWIKQLAELLHANIALWEYPGFGLSPNPLANQSSISGPINLRKQADSAPIALAACSETLICDDIRLVYQHLIDKENIAPSQIILWGNCFGCGPVIDLASHLFIHQKGKKLTRSISLTKMMTLGKNEHKHCDTSLQVPVGVVLQTPFVSLHKVHEKWGNMFENDKKADKIQCPVLIYHGTKNQFVSISQAKKIAHKVPNVWKFVELDCGHAGMETDNEFLDSLIEFGQKVAPSTPVIREAPSGIKPYQVLKDWLGSIDREHLVEKFFENGYFNLGDIEMISDEELISFAGEDDLPLFRKAISSIPDYLSYDNTPRMSTDDSDLKEMKRSSWDDALSRSRSISEPRKPSTEGKKQGGLMNRIKDIKFFTTNRSHEEIESKSNTLHGEELFTLSSSLNKKKTPRKKSISEDERSVLSANK